MKSNDRKESGTAITTALLVVFVFAAITLVVFQIRRDLREASAFAPHSGEHEAWVTLERFFKDDLKCSQMLEGKGPGDTILGGAGPQAPHVGQEWRGTGWVIKDLYVLRREDEASWQLKRPAMPLAQEGEGHIYVKVSLVPKPKDGLSLSVEYLLNAPTSVRLISVPVLQAEAKSYGHCRRDEAEGACYRMASMRGVKPMITLDRAPASVSLDCPRGVIHRAHCLLPSFSAPIWRCINQK